MRNKGTGNWIHRRRVKSAGAPALATVTGAVLAALIAMAMVIADSRTAGQQEG